MSAGLFFPFPQNDFGGEYEFLFFRISGDDPYLQIPAYPGGSIRYVIQAQLGRRDKCPQSFGIGDDAGIDGFFDADSQNGLLFQRLF